MQQGCEEMTVSTEQCGTVGQIVMEALCNQRVPARVKGQLCETAVGLAMLYRWRIEYVWILKF